MTFTLLPYQQEHAAALHAILQKMPYALDLSMLGTGKTYAASQMALDLRVRHVVVVAPVSVIAKWKSMKKDHGIPLSVAFSFQSMRSVKNRQPSHGLLKRCDYWETVQCHGLDCEVHRTRFEPTERFLALLDEGCLLVMDEIQNLKNKGDQLEAARALLKPIIDRFGAESPSRALLLSGSPMDKEGHVVNMFKCLNIMRSNELAVYHPGPRCYSYPGYGEILGQLDLIDPQRYRAANPSKQPYSADSCRKEAYRLFQRVFKPAVSSAMQPQRMDFRLDKYNGMFKAATRDEDLLIESAVSDLAKACRYDENKKTVDFGHSGAQTMQAITSALMRIERAKLGTFVRLMRQRLASDGTGKVVTCVNYTSSLEILRSELAAHQPLVLQGSMTQGQRERVIDRFQEPDTRSRLLIANLSVASTGIDLDDKHGGFPRTCFASPMFNTITLYQLGHRFQRMDTRSSAAVYMVYNERTPELNILNALARKGAVMKETTNEQVEAGVVFPCDYPTYKEEEEKKHSTASLNFTNKNSGETY